jgi:hypothetical protein
LYWDSDEDDHSKAGAGVAELANGAQEKTVELINRMQRQEQHTQTATDVKKREKKSRAKARREEAEALANELAAAGKDPEAHKTSSANGSATHGKASGALTAAGSSSVRRKEECSDSDGYSEEESDSDGSSSEEEGSEASSSEGWVDEDWISRPNESLFCDHKSATFEDNCAYMEKEHSFFLPFMQYLVDAQGLFAYLQEKICSYHTCIYCARVFGDLEAVRKHMKDKSHCKVNFEEDDGALELSEFYKFPKTWKARLAFRRDAFIDRSHDDDQQLGLFTGINRFLGFFTGISRFLYRQSYISLQPFSRSRY